MANYITPLTPAEEQQFAAWVNTKKVPFDPSPNADYDMRGFWKAMRSGDKRATSAISAYDGETHFPDTWKTPTHKTFSNESIYATKDAPHWDGARLIDKSGRVIADESVPEQPKGKYVPLSKQEYEKALGKPITDEMYAKLTSLSANAPVPLDQARPEGAEKGAELQVMKDKSGAKTAADPKPGAYFVANGKKHSAPQGISGVEAYENKSGGKLSAQKLSGGQVAQDMSTLDYLRAEMGGPDYKAPAPMPHALQSMASTGTPMADASKQLNPMWHAPVVGAPVASVALPAAPAPVVVPAYAAGATTQPGYAPPAAAFADPTGVTPGLLYLNESLKKKAGK